MSLVKLPLKVLLDFKLAGLFLNLVVALLSLSRESIGMELDLIRHLIDVDMAIRDQTSGLPVPILSRLNVFIIVPDLKAALFFLHIPNFLRSDSFRGHHDDVWIASDAGDTLEMVLSNRHVVCSFDGELRFVHLRG